MVLVFRRIRTDHWPDKAPQQRHLGCEETPSLPLWPLQGASGLMTDAFVGDWKKAVATQRPVQQILAQNPGEKAGEFGSFPPHGVE